MHTKLRPEKSKVSDNSKDLGIDTDWKNMWEGVAWIHLAQKRD